MKRYNIIISLFLLMLLGSCVDLTDTNDNPNEITQVGGYLHLSNVLSGTAQIYHADNFAKVEIITAMQYIQVLNRIGECNYDWKNAGWTSYYDVLRNNQKMYESANMQDNNFYKGIALILKSFMFGYITDLWGDCPYSEALKGDKGIYAPKFDSQEDIFNHLFKDLEDANTELSKPMPAYTASEKNYDLAYGGNIEKWRKMANSLALRYYMRLSEKLPETAKAGIEKIIGNPSQYPIFTGNDDICQVSYPGINAWDSWPGGPLFWTDNGNSFRNRKPCRTFINVLKELNDPRMPIWFTPVEIQIVVEKAPYSHEAEDVVVGNKRYVHDNAKIMAGGIAYYDTARFVGLPNNVTNRFNFNLTDMNEDAKNPSASYLTSRYNQNSDKLVNATFMSYAEVCFILAEAAYKGWNVGGSAESYYNKGVKASMDYYTVGAGFDTYINQTKAKYNGTLGRIIEQKWISQFLLPESWFDFRRTGLPVLPVDYPTGALQPVMPVRLKYPIEEARNNSKHYNAAVEKLEKTKYANAGNDDHYSKPWVLQGTNKPW